MRTRSCRPATRWPGAAGRSWAAQRLTRAASASTTRVTLSPRCRQRAPRGGAQQCQLHLTACGRRGTRRVGRARRGGAGLSCCAITCGGGPPLKTRASCTGCACARSCGVTHGTVARACWGQRATGATLHRPWSMYATGTGPPRRPRPLGRHDERQRPEHRGASARCWYLLQGVNTGYFKYCATRQTTPRWCPPDHGQSPRTVRPRRPRPACTSRASSRLGGWVVSKAGARPSVRGVQGCRDRLHESGVARGGLLGSVGGG